jgi:hypothetical protein
MSQPSRIRNRFAALAAIALVLTVGCSKTTRTTRQGASEAPQPGASSSKPGKPFGGGHALAGERSPNTGGAAVAAAKAESASSGAEGSTVAATRSENASASADAEAQQERQLRIDRLQAAVSGLEDDGYLVRKTRKRLAWRLIAPDLMWKIQAGKRPAEARRIATRLQTTVTPIVGHPVPIEVYGDLKETILLHQETPPGTPPSR